VRRNQSENRELRALGFLGELKLAPSVVCGSTPHRKLDWTFHSEAVGCMLPAGRESKKDISV